VNEGGVEVGGRAASGVHCPKLVIGVKSDSPTWVNATWFSRAECMKNFKKIIEKYKALRNHRYDGYCIVPTFSFNNDGI